MDVLSAKHLFCLLKGGDHVVAESIKLRILLLESGIGQNVLNRAAQSLICADRTYESRNGPLELAVVKDDGIGLVAGERALKVIRAGCMKEIRGNAIGMKRPVQFVCDDAVNLVPCKRFVAGDVVGLTDGMDVAHQADDSIETFFINLLRGTGLRGLTGITRQRGRIVRPLLFATRKEIVEYAVANRIAYREDSSNRSTKYLRNKIRLGLVPRIREINPQFTALMGRNIGRLSEAQHFIGSAIEKIRSEAVSTVNGVDRIELDRIDAAFPRDFVLYELLNSAYGFKGDVIDALCRTLDEGQSGRRFYAREWVAVTDRGAVEVARIDDEDPCEVEIPERAIRAYAGNSVFYFERCSIDLIEHFGVPPQMAQLDAEKLQWPLRLRRWREGDRFVPFGMTGKKKVSDFLIDEKVSMMEKQRQFVLLSGEEIVWVVGRRIDDRFRLDDQTDEVLRIHCEIV